MYACCSIKGTLANSEDPGQTLQRLIRVYTVCIKYNITKTYLNNFYVVKLGFTWLGIHYFSLFLFKIIDCWYSLELSHRGDSNEYSQSMFWAEIWKKYQTFYLKTISFWWWKFVYLNRQVFEMGISIKYRNNENQPDTPSVGKWPIQRIEVAESTA